MRRRKEETARKKIDKEKKLVIEVKESLQRLKITKYQLDMQLDIA